METRLYPVFHLLCAAVILFDVTFAVLQVSYSALFHFDSGYLSLHVLKIYFYIHHIILWLLYLLDSATMGKCNIVLKGWTGHFILYFRLILDVCHRNSYSMKNCKCYLFHSSTHCCILFIMTYDCLLTDECSCKRHCINTVNCMLGMKTYRANPGIFAPGL